MSQYSFAGIDLGEVVGVSAPMPTKIGKGESPLKHGGFPGKQFLATRQISVQCVWLPTPGQSFIEMELAFALFCAHIRRAGYDRLFLRTNWFYNAVVDSVNTSKVDWGSIEFDITFYLADPRQYKYDDATDLATSDVEGHIAVTFGTNFTTQDGEWTPMRLELTASAGYVAGNQFTPIYVSPAAANGDPLIWSPGATGLTVVYIDDQKAIRSGVEVTSEFDGNFFDIPPSQQMHINSSVGTPHITADLYFRQARP